MTLISRENFEMELKNGITVGDIGRGPTLASDYVSSPLDAQLTNQNFTAGTDVTRYDRKSKRNKGLHNVSAPLFVSP